MSEGRSKSNEIAQNKTLLNKVIKNSLSKFMPSSKFPIVKMYGIQRRQKKLVFLSLRYLNGNKR